MEAASVAWHDLGFTPVGFSEIEPFPSAILKHRFPNTPNYGDLTRYKEWPLEPGSVDLLVGGTPCQSFSVAGLRRGMADPRGNLALVFLGLADHLKPRWILWENVPGVLTSAGGRDFGSFLAGLAELGYSVSWRILDAQNFGVAQRRRRVFVVAYLGTWEPAAAVLLESESLRGDSAASEQARKSASRAARKGSKGNSGQAPDLFERGDDRRVGGVSETTGTLCATGNVFDGQDAYQDRLIPQPYTATSFAQYAEGVGTVRASGGDLGGGSETLLTQPITGAGNLEGSGQPTAIPFPEKQEGSI